MSGLVRCGATSCATFVEHLRFSNRPIEVKHLQAPPFGLGTKLPTMGMTYGGLAEGVTRRKLLQASARNTAEQQAKLFQDLTQADWLTARRYGSPSPEKSRG